jgi:hypothetical protein
LNKLQLSSDEEGRYCVASDNPRIEEKILSQLVETQLTNQFDEVDALAVDIQTDLFKVIQSQADAVTIEGQGLEINQDIRIEQRQFKSEVQHCLKSDYRILQKEYDSQEIFEVYD